MKKISMVMMVFLIIVGSVYTNSYANTICSDMYMLEETVDEYKYEFCNGSIERIYDSSGNLIMKNKFENGLRIEKKGIDKCKFTYDENRNLKFEIRNGKKITYIYEYDSKFNYYMISGFVYNDETFFYTRDEVNRIDGIKNSKQETIAKYIYIKDNNQVEKVLEYKDDEWKECADSTFVGNFNKIRNICSYYDEESELYYENGVFYDVVTNKIIQESKQEDEIQLFTYGDDLDYSIACWQQSLLEDSNFNSGKEWSPTWYEGLSDVEIIARVIYGENTYVAVDQKAIAWVIRNRTKKYGCVPVEVVLEDYQFSAAGVPNDPSYQTIKTQNSGDTGWAGAVYRACLICTTLDEYDWDILSEKPSGMSSQTCYRAWFCYDRFSGNGQMYYDGVAVYDVYIAGYGYVESYDELYNIIDSYSDRNIFFSY